MTGSPSHFECADSERAASPALSVVVSLALGAMAGNAFAGSEAVVPETETREQAGQHATGTGAAGERAPEAQLAEDGGASTAEEAENEETDSGAAAQSGAGATSLFEANVRFRGRVLDELRELGDPEISSFSIWSKTAIGDRIVTNITYDLGKTRMHDFWAQFDIGGGLQVRVGRSSLAWLGEYTESSHYRQTILAAVGTKLTRSREDGVFLFFDRGPWNARFHVVPGSGYEAENNSFKDVLTSLGRTFDIAGNSWLVDVGHYEGRDGPDDALVPRRQTAVHVDGVLGSGQVFRGAAFRRVQDGREHFGGFARLRHRFPEGVWALAEFGTETNHGPLDSRGHSSYLIAGGRYELPWTYTHLSAEYRWRFGAVGDHELLLLFQWLFDFQNPMRN